jgi:hypothetical protein
MRVTDIGDMRRFAPLYSARPTNSLRSLPLHNLRMRRYASWRRTRCPSTLEDRVTWGSHVDSQWTTSATRECFDQHTVQRQATTTPSEGWS